jgi:hypothetical protein
VLIRVDVSDDFEELAPFEFRWSNPDNYPSKSSPVITLSCSWLSEEQLTHFYDKLEEMWEQGEVILFKWIEW